MFRIDRRKNELFANPVNPADPVILSKNGVGVLMHQAVMFSHGVLRAMRLSSPANTRPGPIS